jgi:Lrp/AsnC family leucine-responsive transcriptional regulator
MTKSEKETRINDRKILDVLVENARQPSIEISKKIGLSRQTVSKAINRLENDHVIWGYQAVVDEEKQGLSTYLVLVKRAIKPIDEKIAEKIISRKLEEIASDIGVKIVTSLYCNGSFDWIISFIATDIKQAKKFTEHIKTMYSEYISDLQILDVLFFVKKQGFLNPDVEKLKDFI